MLYVASPIDFHLSIRPDMVNAIDELIEIAGRDGHLVYNPRTAFYVPSSGVKPSSHIFTVNRFVISHCAGLVAFMPANVVTIGVAREIEMAIAQHKPVAVWTDDLGSWRASWSLLDVLIISESVATVYDKIAEEIRQ